MNGYVLVLPNSPSRRTQGHTVRTETINVNISFHGTYASFVLIFSTVVSDKQTVTFTLFWCIILHDSEVHSVHEWDCKQHTCKKIKEHT